MPNDLSHTGREHAWSWPVEAWDEMWKPRNWLKKPPRPHKAHLWHVAAIIAIASYANIISNLVLDDAWHIPFQLGILTVTVLIARRAGTTWTSMGLRNDRIKRGLVVGGSVIGVISVGFLVAIVAVYFFPDLRTVFENETVLENSVGWVLFQAFVRIPIATAFYEEVLFRGVIFGMFARRYSPLVAAAFGSLLFGLWHIAPTLASPDNPLMDPEGVLQLVGAVIGIVGSTMFAGLLFLWVRLYANSVYAPVLAHIGTNSIGMLAALFVVNVL
jgi:CAAX protease family protein